MFTNQSLQRLANFWKREYENEMTDERYEQEVRKLHVEDFHVKISVFFNRRWRYAIAT